VRSGRKRRVVVPQSDGPLGGWAPQPQPAVGSRPVCGVDILFLPRKPTTQIPLLLSTISHSDNGSPDTPHITARRGGIK